MNRESKNQTENPLRVETGFPPFDRVKPEHVVPAMRQVLDHANERIDWLEQNLEPTWVGLIHPLEQLNIPFEYSWGVVSHLMGVKNSDELRKAHEQVLADVVQFGLRAQSEPSHLQGTVGPFVMAMPGRRSMKPSGGLSSKKYGPPNMPVSD
jgi:oligopeptidase A